MTDLFKTGYNEKICDTVAVTGKVYLRRIAFCNFTKFPTDTERTNTQNYIEHLAWYVTLFLGVAKLLYVSSTFCSALTLVKMLQLRIIYFG